MEPGVVAAAVFNKKSKTLGKEIAAFEAKLRELQQKYELGGFVTATKREGDKLHVKVMAAAMNAPAGKAAPPAKGAGWGAKSAKAVGAEIKQSLGWGPKK